MSGGPKFFQTRLGVRHYEHTMPELVTQLTRLNGLLERLVRQVELDRELAGTANAPSTVAATAPDSEDA